MICYIYISLYIYIYISCIYIYYMHIYIHIYIYRRTHTYMYIYIYILYAHRYIYIYRRTHTHIYICIYIHYIYIYTLYIYIYVWHNLELLPHPIRPLKGFEGRKHCWDGWRLTFERCCVHGEDLDGAAIAIRALKCGLFFGGIFALGIKILGKWRFSMENHRKMVV